MAELSGHPDVTSVVLQVHHVAVVRARWIIGRSVFVCALATVRLRISRTVLVAKLLSESRAELKLSGWTRCASSRLNPEVRR